MKGKSEVHPIYQLKTLWKEEKPSIWLASSLKLSRNFSKFKFPQKLDKVRQLQVAALLYDAVKQSPDLKSPILFRSDEIGPLEKEYLVEHFLASDTYHKAHHGGEGFVIDDSGTFLAVSNIENHLQLQITDTDQEIEKSWNKLVKIEETIGKSIDFAFNPRFGYLNSVPAMSGTGLVVTLFLHVPAIIHTGELPELLEKEREDEIEATGLQGSATEMIGDILVARNKCTLGLTEEYIITLLRMWATRAVVAEITIRKKLGNNEHMKNKVARAFGLLTHAYQLETIEALNSFSLVKLGLELGWIETSEPLNTNEIFFNCRRAHLLNSLDKKVDVPMLPRKRAEYLHEMASKMKLVI